ncbi:MAG: bifunctional tetrahydrofolate synthase/dihydrofolate synthase [Gammaproteobacteria bacterium]|nr:bifunctional tetrahydrofolate synthase/dihydrofolate synthase [Gammaproteobacteria bacterium]
MISVNTPVVVQKNQTDNLARFESLEDWLSWQEALHFTAIDLGLDRVRTVAERMGLLEPSFAVLSVAGTNGKGSSVTMLESILRRSGYRTGKYTSPHLIKYNERICVDGESVNDDLICSAFARIDNARKEISLTYFEFGTLAALDIFQRSKVDIAVLEVGLGGRLDAVNILDADAALVTSIDIDHENWLGSDRESIALEKAGIFRNNSPAVCSDPCPPDCIAEYANSIGTDLQLLGHDYHYSTNTDSWSWRSKSLVYNELVRPSLHDDCQMQNAAGVLKLFDMISEKFTVTEEAIKSGLQEFRLEGRFQIIPSVVPYILDVAHNAQSARMLANNLRKLATGGTTHCIVGMLKDKNHETIFKELSSIVDIWYIVDLDSERAEKAEKLMEKIVASVNVAKVRNYNSVKNTLDYLAGHAKAGERIVITGSFLTVRDALLYLHSDLR